MAGRKAVGLDIGTTCVRAAELSWSRDGATLERFGQVALPLGAMRDGEVVDPEAVAEALKELWSRVKFRTKKVIVGVANQKVVVRQVDLPWMTPSELKKSLAFQVADIIPMPLDQAILDFHPLQEITGADGSRQLRVLLVAAARDAIESAVKAVELAGLTPEVVDLTSFAVLRALGRVDGLGLSQVSEALIDVGASVTNIVVSQGGVPRFVRILLLGGADVTETIADRMGVSLESAEQLKQATMLPQDPSAPNQRPEVRVVESAATGWIEEIRGSLDYYLAQPGSARIERIVLSGGGAKLGGLAAQLSFATRLPVAAATPFAGLELGRTGLNEDQLAYVEAFCAVPVGLALGSGIMTAVMAEAPVEESPLSDLETLVYTAPKVNLLPPEIGERRRLRKLQACLALAVVAAGAVVGLLYVQANSGKSEAQARLVAAKSVEAGLQVQSAKLQYVQAEQARIDAARSSLKAAMGSEVLWSKVLDDLRLRLPDGVNMSSLATTAVAATTTVPGVAPAPAAAATALPSNVIATVLLSGSAVSLDAVADELDQLANVPGFANVYLTTTTTTQTSTGTGTSQKFVAYTATADVTNAALSHRYDTITGANK